MGFSSVTKYLGLFMLISSLARRIAEWYQYATADDSSSGEKIDATEWSALAGLLVDSIAEAFGLTQQEASEGLRQGLRDE